ncbi:MAG: hypothetical protein EZS28_038545 [Streblomastix strix]|uniref:Uncharacterized protein n=1 Tax=Streblomastix strix TaxID=222440 RepID=A0A5J4U542_9EUKA|nr:MAG: hypothetical protein EZS28_038545 [Streblomastix strix]
MVDKENRGQSTRVIDFQNNNMHINNGCFTAGLGYNSNIRELDRTYTTRLLEREGDRNDTQCQGNQRYLLRATPFRASLHKSQDQAVLIRSDNTIAVYDVEKQKAKESLIERINHVFLPSEKTQTTNHNNSHPRKIELNDRFTLETMQIRRLNTEVGNDLNDLQDMELHATDSYIRNTVQQTNQQLHDGRSHGSWDL